MAFVINQNAIIKNTIALYVRMGFTMIISFLASRVTLQVLGVEDYGLNNLLSGVVALFSFINGSMGTAVQRFLSYNIGKKDDVKLKKTFGVGLYLYVIITIVTFILLEIFALFFISKLNIPPDRLLTAKIVFQISSLQLVLNIFVVPYAALLRAREEFTKIAYIEIGQALLRLVSLYLLYIISFDKLILLSTLNFIVTLTYVWIFVYYARKFREARTSLRKDREIIKEMFNFVSMLLVTVLASLARDNGIVILINLFFGLLINAAYAVASQVMSLAKTFVQNFKQSMVPQLMASYGAGDTTTMIRLINTGTKITFLLMLFLTIPLMFEMEYVLRLWLKPPPEHSCYLAILALVEVNVSTFTYFHYQGIHATGKVNQSQITMSVLYLFNIFLIWLLFKLGFGFSYALYATIFVSVLQCMSNCFFAHKTYDYPVKKFVKIILSKVVLITIIVCIVMYFTTNLMHPSFVRLVVTFIVSSLIILFLGYFILLDHPEQLKAKAILNRFVKR